ncbi:hypothetical protein B7494_g4875 [Chlorociboria aeruginascens]|nr:hypothetical protein B7494_g4875 [Chlorociboria aeruginascens]
MSIPEIAEKLQECPLVQDLNSYKVATSPPTSSLSSRLFTLLFPSAHAGVNALLATLYISGPPNFLLALCPPNIDPSSLSVMVAFAVGGLLGDTLFHLLPEIFLGEDELHQVKFVLVEPNRNLLLGVAILVGFVTFVAMDKGLRIATRGEGHEHAHSGEVELQGEVVTSALDSDAMPAKSTRSRKKGRSRNTEEESKVVKDTEMNASVKLAGYLNLIADFVHNVTDGLALSSSFYASPTIGATTTVAVFFHEIPHEVGDFALLIQSGFSKRSAMGAQFITALGALLGTFIGIAVQEFGGSKEGQTGRFEGIWGTIRGAGGGGRDYAVTRRHMLEMRPHSTYPQDFISTAKWYNKHPNPSPSLYTKTTQTASSTLKWVPLPNPLNLPSTQDLISRTVTDLALPCRRCLIDGQPGEKMHLVSYNPFPNTPASPYVTASPIFVHDKPCTPYTGSEIPEQQRSRLLCARAYDENNMMRDMCVVPGDEAEARVAKMLGQEAVHYVMLYNAGPGCFAVKVERREA